MSRFRLVPRRRGAVLTLVAISIVALLGMAALAMDIGVGYAARSEAQRVADAAALAGASAFLDFNPPYTAVAPAEHRAREYVAANDIMHQAVDSIAEAEITVDPANQRVRVTVWRREVWTFFARVLGIRTIPVSATAVAEAIDAGSVRCVRPWAVQDLWHEGDTGARPDADDIFNGSPPDTYVPARPDQPNGSQTGYGAQLTDNGMSITLKSQVPVTGNELTELYQPGPGEFMIWSMPEDPELPGCSSKGESMEPGQTGSPAYIYTNSICSCNQNKISIGVDYGPFKPGNTVGPTELGLDSLINRDPTAKWVMDSKGGHVESIYGADSPRVVRIGLIEPLAPPPDGKNNWTMSNMPRVVFTNFADMFVESYVEIHQGPIRIVQIQAKFMYYTEGEPGPSSGSLVKYLRLIE